MKDVKEREYMHFAAMGYPGFGETLAVQKKTPRQAAIVFDHEERWQPTFVGERVVGYATPGRFGLGNEYFSPSGWLLSSLTSPRGDGKMFAEVLLDALGSRGIKGDEAKEIPYEVGVLATASALGVSSMRILLLDEVFRAKWQDQGRYIMFDHLTSALVRPEKHFGQQAKGVDELGMLIDSATKPDWARVHQAMEVTYTHDYRLGLRTPEYKQARAALKSVEDQVKKGEVFGVDAEQWGYVSSLATEAAKISQRNRRVPRRFVRFDYRHGRHFDDGVEVARSAVQELVIARTDRGRLEGETFFLPMLAGSIITNPTVEMIKQRYADKSTESAQDASAKS